MLCGAKQVADGVRDEEGRRFSHQPFTPSRLCGRFLFSRGTLRIDWQSPHSSFAILLFSLFLTGGDHFHRSVSYHLSLSSRLKRCSQMTVVTCRSSFLSASLFPLDMLIGWQALAFSLYAKRCYSKLLLICICKDKILCHISRSTTNEPSCPVLALHLSCCEQNERQQRFFFQISFRYGGARIKFLVISRNIWFDFVSQR